MTHDLDGFADEPRFERFTPTHDATAVDDLDPSFVFDFQAYDDLESDTQRWSTWLSVEPLSRGPEPRPDWVVTSQGAIDTELGILKTGKEADVFLLERGEPDGPSVVMAAKRYRGEETRSFHRSGAYTEGRKTRRSRDARALARKSAYGRSVAAGQWAWAEWEALKRLGCSGCRSPTPCRSTAPRSSWSSSPSTATAHPGWPRPGRSAALLESYFEQLRDAMAELARHGLVHGDLSPYNILAAGERLVIIDLPQMVDLVGNPQGMDFLLRDCANVCGWFRARGLEVDEHELYGELLAHAW